MLRIRRARWFIGSCCSDGVRRDIFGRKPKGSYLASTRHPAGPRKQHGLAVLLRRVQLVAHGRINPALDHLGDVLNVALRVVDTGHIAVIVYAEINGTALGVGEGAHALEPVLRPAPPDLHPVVAAGCLAIQIQRHVPILHSIVGKAIFDQFRECILIIAEDFRRTISQNLPVERLIPLGFQPLY